VVSPLLKHVLKQKIRQLKKTCKSGADYRKLIRLKALLAYYRHSSCLKQIASHFDLSVKSLKRWIKRYESDGLKNLSDRDRKGCPCQLTDEQKELLKAALEDDKQRVRVARHIAVLLQTLFGVVYSVGYLPELLRNLGLSFRKAVTFLIKRDNEKRREWLQEKLPTIFRQKIEEGWRIFYQDEVGFQTEGTLAATWGVRGQATEVLNYGRHGRMNMMGAFELGTGLFHGVLTSFRVDAMRFRRFICSLKRRLRTDKILLICDNARFHKAKWLTEWVQTQKDWLRMEFLPAYSPDFNPIERLWRWMKTEYTHNRCWASKDALKQHLRHLLKDMPKQGDGLQSLMKKENERYRELCAFYQTDFKPLFAAAG
jgi:transposase